MSKAVCWSQFIRSIIYPAVFILILVFLIIILSLVFIYSNGFQDGSSVTATAIGCRALRPIQAVSLAAACEFLGAVFGGSLVANTIQSITNWPAQANLLPVLISALVAAVSWNYFTRTLKLPSSSTHALVGGIIGSVIAGSGSFYYIVWGRSENFYSATGVSKTLLSLIMSPIAGFIVGYIMLALALIIFARASTRINRKLKGLQWLTLAAMSFGHGANDTQKAMGLILLALNASHLDNSLEIPLWVRLISGTAMALGIVAIVPGIVRKVGSGIYRLRPLHGLTTQLVAGSILIGASVTGSPVSASQIISSAVVGVGTADRIKGVHWLIVKDILIAWFMTIPCSALLAWLTYNLVGRLLALGLRT